MTLRRLMPFGALLVTACFPTITHGPRVEDGFVFGLTAATTSGDTHTEGDEGGFALREGTFGPFIGQGWAFRHSLMLGRSARGTAPWT